MKNHPTTAEEAMLDVMRSYPYMTAEQIALATGQHFRGVQARCNTLRADEEKEKGRGGLGYIWRVHRRTTEQNTKLAFAYTLMDKSKKYFELMGKEVVLATLNPKSPTLDHNLAITDVLIRAKLLEQRHPDTIRLLEFMHDRDLHRLKTKKPLFIIPDGLVDFKIRTAHEVASYPVLFEIDMGTERERWFEKIERYTKFIPQQSREVFGYEYPTIAVIVMNKRRLQELKEWTARILANFKTSHLTELFYFTVFTPDMTPEQLFLEPIYQVTGKEGTYTLFDL